MVDRELPMSYLAVDSIENMTHPTDIHALSYSLTHSHSYLDNVQDMMDHNIHYLCYKNFEIDSDGIGNSDDVMKVIKEFVDDELCMISHWLPEIHNLIVVIEAVLLDGMDDSQHLVLILHF